MLAYRVPDEPILYARDGVTITTTSLVVGGIATPLAHLSHARRHTLEAGFAWPSKGVRTAAAVVGTIVTIGAAQVPGLSYPGVFGGVFVAWIFGIAASRTIRCRTHAQHGLVIFRFGAAPITLTSQDPTFVAQVADTLARLNPSLWVGANASTSNLGRAPYPGGAAKLVPLALVGAAMATCLHVRASSGESTKDDEGPTVSSIAAQDGAMAVDVSALPVASEPEANRYATGIERHRGIDAGVRPAANTAPNAPTHPRF